MSRNPDSIRADVNELYEEVYEIDAPAGQVWMLDYIHDGEPPQAIRDEYREVLADMMSAIDAVRDIEGRAISSLIKSVRRDLRATMRIIEGWHEFGVIDTIRRWLGDHDSFVKDDDPRPSAGIRPSPTTVS